METIENKFMFDTNIFNKILNGKIDLVNSVKKKSISFFCTHIQKDELNNCKDENRRKRLVELFNLMDSEELPTDSFVLGVSRLGGVRLGNGGFLERLRLGNLKHTNDALIGEVAIKNNLVLVTNDENLIKNVEENNGTVINLDSFLEIIK